MTKEKEGCGIEIRKKKTVVSTQACRPGKVYPLAVIDHLMGLYNLRLVFYYEKPQTASTKSIINALEESFSEVLTSFPAVTGRLKLDEDGNWVVKCNDAGVRTVEAYVAGTSVSEWLDSLHPGDFDPDLALTLWEPMADDTTFWSPFQVQITEFKDGGFAIGLSCPHMQADPHCASLLVKAWGDIHRRSCIANQPFFHPHGLRLRKTPNTSTASVEYYRSKHSSQAEPTKEVSRFSTVTFRFSDSSVRRCISEISESPAAFAEPTPFVALAGLLWSACARATRGHGGSSLERELGLVTEFRKLMHAPLPHGFFGNAVHFSHVRAAEEELAGDGGLAIAARAIRDDSFRTEEEFRSVIDWWEEMRVPVEGGSGEGKGKFRPPVQMYGSALTCANLEGMMGYGAVFEEGSKPLHVSCRIIPPNGEGVVLVLPSSSEGLGRTVIATLPEEVARKVRGDPIVQRFDPKILFGGLSERGQR